MFDPGSDVSPAVKRMYGRIVSGYDLADLEIPHSFVYFIRYALYERLGIWYDVFHVQAALWLEGFLDPNEVKSLPEDYVNQFMGGAEPNMIKLRNKVRLKFYQRQGEHVKPPWEE